MWDFCLNARDFGVSGSEYKTVVHTAKGSNVFVLDDIGDFKVGDEVFLPGCNVHLEGAMLFERKDMNPRTTISSGKGCPFSITGKTERSPERSLSEPGQKNMRQ